MRLTPENARKAVTKALYDTKIECPPQLPDDFWVHLAHNVNDLLEYKIMKPHQP